MVRDDVACSEPKEVLPDVLTTLPTLDGQPYPVTLTLSSLVSNNHAPENDRVVTLGTTVVVVAHPVFPQDPSADLTSTPGDLPPLKLTAGPCKWPFLVFLRVEEVRRQQLGHRKERKILYIFVVFLDVEGGRVCGWGVFFVFFFFFS